MRVLLVLAIIALSGCGSKDAVAPEAPQEAGAIRGVIVDEAIVPVPDVRLEILGENFTTSSDANGAYELPTLPIAEYLIRASKAGFETTDTAWDGAAPPQIQLRRVVTDAPYVVPMQWDGFLGCSFYVATLFGTGCLLQDYIPDESRNYATLDRRPSFVQSELAWEHGQPAGENLCMRHYASSGIGGDLAAEDVCGPTPQIATIDEDKVEQSGIGNTRGLERMVWVDHWIPGVVGLALDQEFVVFTHQFYNMQPAEGWTFGTHGAP